MTAWSIFAVLLVIAAIVLYEVQRAIRQYDMWLNFERDEHGDEGL
jgi:hypothetical protein